MLKIRSHPTECEIAAAQNKEWNAETHTAEFHAPVSSYENRNSVEINSHSQSFSGSNPTPQPLLDLSELKTMQESQVSQLAEPPCTSSTLGQTGSYGQYEPGTRKSTRENFGKSARKFMDQPSI